jgi:hypothetical protein
MTESESEAETLERLELALRRIAELARKPRPAGPPAPAGAAPAGAAPAGAAPAGAAPAGAPPAGPEIDQAALRHSLDMLITRLRNGLNPPRHTE